MKKTNTLLFACIVLLTIFITLLSICMKDTATSRMEAKQDRKELKQLNEQQLKILKNRYEAH